MADPGLWGSASRRMISWLWVTARVWRSVELVRRIPDMGEAGIPHVSFGSTTGTTAENLRMNHEKINTALYMYIACRFTARRLDLCGRLTGSSITTALPKSIIAPTGELWAAFLGVIQYNV